MSNVKNAIEIIENCKICNGHGYTGNADKEGNFDIEFCECNPNNLPDPLQIA